MKRAIPLVNIKEYAREGWMGIHPGDNEVRIELNKCTLFTSREELVSLCASLLHTATKVWGEEILKEVEQCLNTSS